MKRFSITTVIFALFNMLFVIEIASGQTTIDSHKIITNGKPLLSRASSSNYVKGENTVFFKDNFDFYQAGQQLACQDPVNWTTWNNAPCTSTDAYVVDTYSYSAPNSVNISYGNSLVNKFGKNGHGFGSGKFKISFRMFIPTGQKADWKLLYNYEFNASTAMEVSFENGTGSLAVTGNADLATFNYSPSEWMLCEVYVDINDDVARLVVDSNTISAWKWTGNTNLNRLSAINFKGNMQTDNCNYFIDDFRLEKHSFPFPEMASPTNFDVNVVSDYAILTWDDFASGSWIEWDDGDNNDDGIGLTGGGTFYVASHWNQEDLTAYNGYYLTKIKYYHFDIAPTASFVIKVWQGENAGTLLLSQNVDESIPGQWNEVLLDTPILIDDSQELWFGYEVTHGDGENPAGIDAGPAIQYNGDMISLDGSTWVSMAAEYGLDYNWNLAGFVSAESGDYGTSIPLQKQTFVSYYNIYLNYNNQGYELLDSTTESPYYYEGGNFYFLNCFYVTAVYENYFESDSSNEDCDIITDSIVQTANQYLANPVLRTYPNPATNVVNIESEIPIMGIKVYNYAGQVVASERVNGKIYHLNTSQYKPGIYFMRIETKNGIISKRIVIE